MRRHSKSICLSIPARFIMILIVTCYCDSLWYECRSFTGQITFCNISLIFHWRRGWQNSRSCSWCRRGTLCWWVRWDGGSPRTTTCPNCFCCDCCICCWDCFSITDVIERLASLIIWVPKFTTRATSISYKWGKSIIKTIASIWS